MLKPVSSLRAMVLAAGLGTRMRPLTLHRPKPLIEVAGKALLEYALDLLREVGVSQAVINQHYLADQITAYARTVADMHVSLSDEPELLETGGGVRSALPLLGKDAPFFVLNSDTICLSAPRRPVLQQLYDALGDKDLVLLLMPRDRALGYDGAGDFIRDDSGDKFRRLTPQDAGKPAFVFTGVQLLQPRIFDGCPKGAFSMNEIYNRYAASDGWFDASAIGFVIHEGDWLHVGDPPARDAAEDFIKKHAVI